MTERIHRKQIFVWVVAITIACNIGWQLLTSLPVSFADGDGDPRPRGTAPSGLEQISHQGVIAVNNVRFSGSGLFRFGIIDPDSDVNLWTNDGTNLGGAVMPDSPVSLFVTRGVYSVQLGSPPMPPIPTSIFIDSNLQLRIWFDDGVNGVHQLVPDQALTVLPYAKSAETAAFAPGVVPIGTIAAWHKNLTGVPLLSDGWVECNGQTLADSVSPLNGQVIPNLNSASGYAGGRFLRGGTSSGTMQVATSAINIVPGQSPSCPDPHEYINDSDGTIFRFRNIYFHSPSGSNSADREYEFVRPVNMSVVWIMRVK